MKRMFFILVLFFYSFFLASQLNSAKVNSRIIFNSKEKVWLNNNKVVKVRVACVPPLHCYRKGIRGISIDYMNLISKEVGFKIKYLTNIPWKEALNNVKSHKKIDLLLTAKITEERKKMFVFTKEYILSPLVIFVRKNSSFIGSINDLKNKRVSVENAFVIHKMLIKNYPSIKLSVKKNTKEALKELAEGRVDGYVGNLTIGTYIIEKNGFNNIKVAAPSPFGDHNQAMLIRNDWPELASIINKVLRFLPQDEIRKIQDRWLSPIRYDYGIRTSDIVKWILLIVSPVFLMLFLIYYKKIKLEKEVKNRKKAEKELIILKEIAEKANRAKSDFLANMSHELRTPLNAVLGFSQILREKEIDQDKIEMFDMVLDSGNHLLCLIENVLDLEKIELGELKIEEENIQLDKLVKQVENVFVEQISEKGLNFNVKVDDKVDRCFLGDELRIKQILINLINNALKFTYEGSISLFLNKKDDEIEFIVEDTGIGIDKEKQSIIFDKFVQGEHYVTKRYGGSGLGLAIVRELVDKMNGSIKIESKTNVGTKFFIKIPFVGLEGECKSDEVGEVHLTNKVRKILLAEDDKISQLFMKELLNKDGIQIDLAENGVQVLEKLEKEDYDLILMDIQMPKMTGVEATTTIRKSTKSYSNIPIVALTAYALKSDREEFLSAGMNGYASKPVVKKDLFNEINKLFK